ncbi:unnamed protein product [Camellia sinensis]
MYFNEGETKFNRPERNYDGPIKATQDGNISVFKQKVRGIGAAVNDVLNLKDLKKARWYVLNNCDEGQPYVRQYMDELERQGLRNVQERLESEFHTWFLKYVTKQQLEGTMDASNQLMNLARGPDSRVTRYSGCIINGTRFHTQDRDMNRKTQNSGVVVKGDHKGEAIDFYGVVRDIVELKYLGRNRVFLFKCDWWDVGNEKNGMKFDDYKYVSVNVTRTWYKDEPFVLACQAIQVLRLYDLVELKVQGDGKSVCVPLHVLTQPHALRRNLLKTQLRLKSLSPKGMSTRGRGRAGYVPRPHAPTPHASTKSVRSSTQSTPGPHASIKSVRSSTLHPFTSESVHEVTSQVSHSDTSSTHCNTDVGTSKGKRGRGKSRSLKLAKLKNQGVRLPIQICKVSGRPYGEASEKFTSELGIVTRQFAPQNVPSWTDISEEDKETLVAHLQEGFKFTNEPYAIESILNLMHDRYKSYRHDLRQRFRSFPTMESALADPPENMEKETWKFLCEKWSDKDYKVRCGKNKLNREKLKVLHTAGSKAFRKVQYDERDRATGEELGLVELYKKTHFSEKKEAWCMLMLRLDYKLEKRQEKAIEEGSCPMSDEQLSIEVFGQKVGYIRGLGRGRKPSTTLSGKLTRAQLERDNEAATREAEEQRRINEELVGRIQILESDRTEYNAKVDFLMQQISRRVPSTDSSS